MENIGLNELRERFLSFFEKQGHQRLSSAPLVPQSDKSLLVINSGMAPLKPYFSGEATPPSPRATSCQKCIRTPDIERVGKTSRHGTFFEMLGNFSFGDYFKREAIQWAWQFCREELDIPVERLYVSVYLDDDEAYDIWTKEIGVDPSHMKRLGKADNFWEIGSGPCGPCSEIYFDRGEQYCCGSPDCAVGCDCDRYVEFWNLVFTQFNSDGAGNYAPLERKNIDTGMGLERLACIMQGVDNLFEVDTIRNIINHVAKIAGISYGDSEKSDVSLRVITDHIRSTVMMTCDGILPSNEGRGYILRRLLRRAARHGRLLGITEPFLFEVCNTVINESGGAYPELVSKADYIRRVLKIEEERFGQTIDSGLGILKTCIDDLRSAGGKQLSGCEAFKLYDTFGFPVDLTLEILEEQGLELDKAAFDDLMNEQRQRARAARTEAGDLGWTGIDFSEISKADTEFLGYSELSAKAKVLAIIAEGELQDQAGQGAEVTILLDRTPFYAESGGQVGDAGTLVSDKTHVIVNDVKKSGGRSLHKAIVQAGVLSVGDMVDANVDQERRRAIMRAHSATHLLHKALKKVLGDHVEQAGSLVEPDMLRFDFTHFSSLTSDELSKVADMVNESILEGLPVEVSEMPIARAKEMGAVALFSEKYGDVVRVVQMGGFSTELCGGTHVENTAKISMFLIRSEASVAAGVRRIDAFVGKQLISMIKERMDLISQVSQVLHVTPQDMYHRIEQDLNEMRALRRDIDRLKLDLFKEDAKNILFSAREIGSLKVITARKDGIDADSLRKIGDWLRDKEDSIVAVLSTVVDDKITFLSVCGKKAVEAGISAGKLISRVCASAGGKGGGKPDSAMGGGKDILKIDDALAQVDDFVVENMK